RSIRPLAPRKHAVASWTACLRGDSAFPLFLHTIHVSMAHRLPNKSTPRSVFLESLLYGCSTFDYDFGYDHFEIVVVRLYPCVSSLPSAFSPSPPPPSPNLPPKDLTAIGSPISTNWTPITRTPSFPS